MKPLIKTAMAGLLGLLALGTTAAFAGDYSNSNHRSHRADDYDHYAKDRYYKAGPHRGDVSFSINIGKAHYDRRYDRRRNARRVVYRDVFQTRYRARIVLTEEIVYRRKGARLVCTVRARGPEADYVSKRRIHRIANRHCSPRARVRVFA